MNKEFLKRHSTPLVYDYFYEFDKVSEFFNGDFRSLIAYGLQADKILSRDLKRDAVTTALTEQNQKYGCGHKTLENISNLNRVDACAVVTGQQTGLFGGPLYTIYKVLTAVKLADYLNHNVKRCFVPIFWLASDDHDFAEINHIILLDKENKVQKIHYKGHSTALKMPVSKIMLTSEIDNCIQQLISTTPDSEFKQEILTDIKKVYQPGQSLVDAFARWMTRLFRSHGLIIIDAGVPIFKKLGKRVFHKEIAGSSPSTQQALRSSQRLKRLNYHPQIQLHRGKLNLFFAEKERLTIENKSDGFVIKGTSDFYEKDEFLALAEKKPHFFSPNVLLRSIYQDTLLPTAAYVGGPSEIAYLAQMKNVYESFDLSMPVIYPRKTVTIIEKKIEKIMNNFGLNIPDIWNESTRPIDKIIGTKIPESIDETLKAVSSHLEQDLKSLKKQITAFEPTLEKPVTTSMRRIDYQIQFMKKKILQASKKRNRILIRQLQKVKNNLYPDNHLQERTFNIVPFLIKYGYTFIERLYREIDIEDPGHQVIRL